MLDEQVRATIRQLRFERGLTIRQLAAAADMSAATLSRLETGARRLTVQHLDVLATALSVPPQTLLDPGELPQRPRARDGRRWQPLGPARTSGRRAYLVEIPVDAEQHPHSHEGHQWLYVVDGELRLTLDGRTHDLAQGTAAAFDTWRPHALGALRRPGLALIIFSPRGHPLRTASPD